MTATLNHKVLGLEMPISEPLSRAPDLPGAGSCLVNDPRGTDRWIYVVTINFTFVFSFWRYDTWTTGWQKLTNPPGTAMSAGSSLVYDVSQGGIWWLATSTSSGSRVFSFYNISTGIWSSKNNTNLPATTAVDGCLVHPDSTVSPGAGDDYVYYTANGVLYRYSISGDTWDTTRTSPPSTPGNGCPFLWNPAYDPDKLILIQGGGSSVISRYSVSANTWTNSVTYTPVAETFDIGTSGCVRPNVSAFILQQSTNLKFFSFDPTGATLTPLGTATNIADGAGMAGNRICYVTISNVEFVYFLGHTANFFYRMTLVV